MQPSGELGHVSAHTLLPHRDFILWMGHRRGPRARRRGGGLHQSGWVMVVGTEAREGLRGMRRGRTKGMGSECAGSATVPHTGAQLVHALTSIAPH
eukprot:364827-Chlamydomonas_euryale.AAC.1